MSTPIRVYRDITNVAQPPRRIVKDFTIARDLADDPIELGEAVFLGLGLGLGDPEDGIVAVDIAPATDDAPITITVARLERVGMDVGAALAAAVNRGWTVDR